VAKFYARYEKALRKSATVEAVGRLQGKTDVVIADVADAAVTRTAQAQYELFGPGDVQRLAAGAITRRFPAPHSSDAEVEKVALVEFAEADLPWRYTPHVAGTALRPWLVLVVGQWAPDDVGWRPDGRVTLGLTAQNNHKLSESAQWAHVHDVDGHRLGRVIASPRRGAANEFIEYLPETEYVACLVPAFTADGADSWNGTQPVTCDLYDWWTFRTGPDGDFPELAEKLHEADLDALLQRAGKPFGRAEVGYTQRTTPAKTESLATAGALMLPPSESDPPKELHPEIAQEVKALSERIVTPDGRGVISAPRYDAAFSDANAVGAPPVGGWIDQLRGDPRLRGSAGLGAWNAIAWQDRIADAAAAKAGDLAIARDRIGHVAFGVEASRSLWRRRLPADPVERLAVLAPALGRLVTTTETSVLDDIAGRTPDLTRALMSSAARRVLRPGPARTALTADGSAPFGAVLAAANECHDPPDPAALDRRNGDPHRAIRKAVIDAADAAGGDEELAHRVLDALGENPSPGRVAAALRALAPDESGGLDRDAIEQFLRGGEFPEPDRTMLEWPVWMNQHDPRPPCKPVDLGRLSKVVADAIDPTVPRPPAVERVLSTLPGITHIGPVEIEPELDLPLWSFLSEKAPDWMLPGAGDLIDGDVVAVSTNPTFVEALLVGANHQAVGELRWRNFPLVTRWSPLRKFWQRPAGQMDILPIKTWPTADAFGTAALVPPERSAEAVVVFKTTLFRRYPSTVVYLYPKVGDWEPPAASDNLTGARKLPTFTGTIGKDITFFGFGVAPEALKTHWVVLEEPPAGYRFYQKPEAGPSPDAALDSASNFAYQRFALPVRVLIGELMS
jgi:hypothetical protein